VVTVSGSQASVCLLFTGVQTPVPPKKKKIEKEEWMVMKWQFSMCLVSAQSHFSYHFSPPCCDAPGEPSPDASTMQFELSNHQNPEANKALFFTEHSASSVLLQAHNVQYHSCVPIHLPQHLLVLLAEVVLQFLFQKSFPEAYAFYDYF
jgi:hypothetical protein